MANANHFECVIYGWHWVNPQIEKKNPILFFFAFNSHVQRRSWPFRLVIRFKFIFRHPYLMRVWWMFYSFDSLCAFSFSDASSVYACGQFDFFFHILNIYATCPFVVRMAYTKYVYLVLSPQLRIPYPDAHTYHSHTGSGRIFFLFHPHIHFIHSFIHVLFLFHPSSMHSWLQY